jgi:hypothetical protein
MHGLPCRALARDLPETALHATSRHPTPRSPATPFTWAVVWQREVVHGGVNSPRIDGMQGVRGSNPLSSTPGQTASPPSTARESPAPGSKSAAISPERPIQRPARRCRRPASLASSPGGPGPTRAAAGGPVRQGRSITDRRADLIVIRVLHGGLFPQDRSCDLPSDARWRPLRTARFRWRVHQTWTRHAPLAGAAARRIADLARQGRPPPAAPDKRAPPGRSPC